MVAQDVQGVEVMEVVLELGPFCNGEAHACNEAYVKAILERGTRQQLQRAGSFA